MNLSEHRPAGYTAPGDQSLLKISRDLSRMLTKAQRSELAYDTLRLPNKALNQLAATLVEFAEDIDQDIGLWRSLEQSNLAFFGTPLPLIVPAQPDASPPSMKDRLRHLLWVLYGEIEPDLILSPEHQDLDRLASLAADFLAERFAKVRRGSGLKEFLAQPNQFGWDIKRKLLWLGQHSYLFRYHFQNYIEEQGGQVKINTIDDFVCQHTTSWSGLGVIDILAATLDIPDEQRAELRSWYERHVAYYRVLTLKQSSMTLLNLINDQPYTVEMEKPADFFKVGQVVFGSLVPWRGGWYWSGEQLSYNDLPEETIQQVKQDFLAKTTQIAYRYSESLAEEARLRIHDHYDKFVKYHGADLVTYPDGLTMAASLQKMYRLQNEALLPQERDEILKKHGRTSAAPKMPFPQELIESDNGIGVYFNREEGQEIMVEFNDILNGLKKGGGALTEDEAFMLRNLIYSPSISPAFVQRLVQEYGDASIATAFLIRHHEDKTYLAYLLRRYKGHFYRKRYPHLTIV